MQRFIRSAVIHFPDSCGSAREPKWSYLPDAILWIADGRVKQLGPAQLIAQQLPDGAQIEHYPDQILIPGLIDMHVHYPQLEMIAAYGTQLLDWLNRYTFPVEQKYADKSYAARQASAFLDQLLAQGTTTALVFATSAVSSVDAFFEEAHARNLRMISGKVLMDRHAPAALCDTAVRAYDESAELIERWRGVGRLNYAVTPRFAPTSTDAQLRAAGELLQDYPETYLHTHLAENVDECAWVAELFPSSRSYLDAYAKSGLVTDRAVFAHGIHLDQQDHRCLADAGSTLCHCPSSNLFLGSGLFSINGALRAGVQVGVGTDVGGGTSLSMLSTLGDAYKVQQMAGESLTPQQALYLATLGAARALHLDTKIGNFEVGKEADCVLLDPQAIPQLQLCLENPIEIEALLFALMILGDERAVKQTWVMGEPALKPHRHSSSPD